MAKSPDPPGPVQLLVILFPRTCQRISTAYSRFELAVQSFYPHIIHPAWAIILSLVLAVLTGPIGLIVATSLGWLVTFTWITTSVTTKSYPPFGRFTLAAIGPALLWTGLAFLAFHYAPASPGTEILSAINRLSKQLESERTKGTDTILQPKQEPTRPSPKAQEEETKPSPQIPSPKEPKVETAVLSIELAPRVLTHDFYDEIDGQRRRHWEYGFGMVARIRNTGKTTEHVRALYIVGDVDADFGDYVMTFGVNRDSNETSVEYQQRKPYYRVSLVSWPINDSKIEPNDEQFVRFMILDPTNTSTKVIIRGTDSSRYFGFRAQNPSPPSILTTVPRMSLFVTFGKSLHREPGSPYFYAPSLRDEIKTDRLKFQLKMSNTLEIVSTKQLQEVDLIPVDIWNNQTPQGIFFKTSWGRIDPIEKDPIIENLK